MLETDSVRSPLNHCLWGKQHELGTPENPHAYYPLVCHLVDTAALAGALFDALFTDVARLRMAADAQVSVADLRALVGFWAGLHDVGKISPPFQRKVGRLFDGLTRDPAYRVGPDVLRDDLHHSQASHWALIDVLADLGYPRTPQARKDVGHQIAQLLGGHHGRFWEALDRLERQAPRKARAGLGDGAWEDQCHAHARVLRDLTGAHAVPPHPLPVTVAVVVAGLVMVADWLASQGGFIRARLPFLGWTASPEEVHAHWKRSVEDAPGIVAAAGLGRAEFRELGFQEQFGFAPNPLQASLVEELPSLVSGPGLLLVTAPPGEGKTEAALYAAPIMARAAGVGGLVFALPTMATADAMHKRVAEFAEKVLSGPAALTKVHSTAWLSTPEPGEGEGKDKGGVDDDGTDQALLTGPAHEPTQWLLGARRGLLAPLSVVTIDQLLSGVLPVRYNVMRLLAGSGKVVVVDEAHAYGPWMNALLLRLVEWLGAFRAPVILLSATLTGTTARAMVDAYRRGAGHDPYSDEAWSPVYPGWLFVDVADGSVSEPRRVHSERARTLRFDVRPVRRADSDTKNTDGSLDRLSVIGELLQPVLDEGGNVLVCCTTVAEAQATWDHLHTWLGKNGGPTRPELHLLHSRYRVEDRAETTSRIEAAFGKNGSRPVAEQAEAGSRIESAGAAEGPRPRAAIVVATQIVEQSLDLDFDLVVTDLAPLAQLLQRSGRCRRHEQEPDGTDRHAARRPAWLRRGLAADAASAGGDERGLPTVVVLDPVDGHGRFELPKTWGKNIYDESLLQASSRGIREHPVVAVPDDVQHLIDAVYADDFGGGTDAGATAPVDAAETAARRRRVVTEMTERQLAEIVDIKAPYDMGTDLHRLSSTSVPVDESLITTRLGADSGQVVCVYDQGHDRDARWTLDEEGEVPVPGWGSGRPLTRAEQRTIAVKMIPTPGRWLTEDAQLEDIPKSWERSAVTRYWLILVLRRTDHGAWRGRLAKTVEYSRARGLSEVDA